MDSDETEFMENIFDALCSSLNELEIKKLFLDAEGIDLMVLMMKYALFYLLRNSKLNMYNLGRRNNHGRGPLKSWTTLCQDKLVQLLAKHLLKH